MSKAQHTEVDRLSSESLAKRYDRGIPAHGRSLPLSPVSACQAQARSEDHTLPPGPVPLSGDMKCSCQQSQWLKLRPLPFLRVWEP